MRKLVALLAAVALPRAIGAATLTVEPDKLTYTVGETRSPSRRSTCLECSLP